MGGGRSPEPIFPPRAAAADLRSRLPIRRLQVAIRRVLGQSARAVADSQTAIEAAQHGDLRLDVMAAMTISRDLQGQPFKAHTVIRPHGSLEALASMLKYSKFGMLAYGQKI